MRKLTEKGRSPNSLDHPLPRPRDKLGIFDKEEGSLFSWATSPPPLAEGGWGRGKESFNLGKTK